MAERELPQVASAATDIQEFAAGALAGRIGTEMAHLAELASALQDNLSGYLAVLASDGHAIRQVQSLDRLTQVLQDLTRVMAALADGLPKDLRLTASPVLRVIRLRDLSRALAASAPGGPLGSAETTGDVAWL
jgi:hypothetical protein